MGLLSLLGFIGLLTGEKGFYGFFAFAVDFEYWFMKTDEMLEEYMSKSASRGFYCGMITTAGFTLFSFFIKHNTANEALTAGLAFGWSIAVIAYALSTVYYGVKEQWRLDND